MRKFSRISWSTARKSFFGKEIKNFENFDFCFKLPAFFVENCGYFAYFNGKIRQKSQVHKSTRQKEFRQISNPSILRQSSAQSALRTSIEQEMANVEGKHFYPPAEKQVSTHSPVARQESISRG